MKLKDIKEMNFDPKPIGKYQVEIMSAEDGYTKEKGTPFTRLDLLIVDGDFRGGHLFHTVWRTASAIGFLKPFLIAAGFTEEDDIEVRDKEVILYETELKGRQLIVEVTGFKTYKDADGNEKKSEILSKFERVQHKIDSGTDDGIAVPF